MARCPKGCRKNTGAKFKEKRTPNVVLRAWDQKDPRKPTFLLNSVGHGFLDPSRPHHRRIRVGIIRHGHWNRAQRQGHLRLRAKSSPATPGGVFARQTLLPNPLCRPTPPLAHLGPSRRRGPGTWAAFLSWAWRQCPDEAGLAGRGPGPCLGPESRLPEPRSTSTRLRGHPALRWQLSRW